MQTSTTSKIQEIDELAGQLQRLRSEDGSKTVVQCHGVFDLLHIGHIRHLQQAREHGDLLVVTVTPDRFVNKGPHRPAFAEDLRAEALAALGLVDYVTVNRWPTAVEAIRLLKPNVYVKGPDYQDAQSDVTGAILDEEEAVRSVGGRIELTDGLTDSSSRLINQYLPTFSDDVRDYLASLATKHSSGEVVGYLERARSLKVLLVGEAIVDEYYYCQTLGKSGKEPVLAARYESSERFAGGILAIANHVADFSDRASVLTFLGTGDSASEFAREKVDNRVETLFLDMADGAPTIVKRRFVEIYPTQKLFELYMMEDEPRPSDAQALCERLERIVADFDVVIVADYGHGMLVPEAVEILCSRARFLAINTQVNAGNGGFNTVSKYRHAHYVCVSEHELRVEARSRHRELRDIVQEVASRLSCDRMVITRGQLGSLCYSSDEGFIDAPALAVRVVDRVGAGDAVFSITALCVALGAPIDVMGLVANAVGSQAVAIMGNSSFIERVPLFKYIDSLLKF